METKIETNPVKHEIFYPHSDGKPLAENTIQLEWIVLLFTNLRWLFEDATVFVAADLFWYPVEGNNKIKTAPDVMVAFNRPKGDRMSYKQWEEADIPPNVVIDVLSPGNTVSEMIRKHAFYEKYGVEEYLIVDPDKEAFFVYEKEGTRLVLRDIEESLWQSRLLKIWLDGRGEKLTALLPDQRPLRTLEDAEKRVQHATLKAKEEEERARKEEERANTILKQSVIALYQKGMSISEIAQFYKLPEEATQVFLRDET